MFNEVDGIQILSKSKLEKCEKTSDSGNLNCSTKIVLNLAVPSGSSGGEASIVAEIVEVEDNSSSNMQTVRIPPVITVNKSAAYALYDLTYIRDVPYKPQEYHVTTRKCEPDAGPDIVQICERQDRPAGSVANNNNQDYNDIEEEMIRAAIEASKKEAEGSSNPLLEERPLHMEDDDDIAIAVTMSLKSAEEEVLRSQGYKASTSEIGASAVTAAQGPQDTQALNGRLAAPSSPFDDDSDDVDEQPLVRHRPRRAASGSLAPPNADRSRSGSPEEEHASINPAERGSGFPSEWGGISSEEHDEAVMLEAAMFGGIPETGYNHLPFLPPQPRAQPRPPSPSLTAQRLIREQQDDEYVASLQADRDKEMKSIRDAEARQLEEETARKAFLEEEKKKEEEAQRKLEEEQELERQLDAKEASLPKEPQADEENAITLLIRMPDGTRRGRRFLKSDKLQTLFNFIDIARVVKPNTYRLVRPYPRHAFGDGESESTLNDLGLTSKQEALFLELI